MERLQESLSEQAQRHEMTGDPAVLLVSPLLRPWIAKLVRNIRNVHVLAYNEIPDDRKIEMLAVVG
jgi:flagellar biosynthesis protein FlhA